MKEMLARFTERINKWREYDDRKLKSVYTADRKQLRHVRSLIRQRKYQEAHDAAMHLDTIIRDLVPEEIWDFLEEKLEIPA